MKTYQHGEELDHSEKLCDCKDKTKLIWTSKGGCSERWCSSCGKTHEIRGGRIEMFTQPNWKQWYIDNGHHLK